MSSRRDGAFRLLFHFTGEGDLAFAAFVEGELADGDSEVRVTLGVIRIEFHSDSGQCLGFDATLLLLVRILRKGTRIDQRRASFQWPRNHRVPEMRGAIGLQRGVEIKSREGGIPHRDALLCLRPGDDAEKTKSQPEATAHRRLPEGTPEAVVGRNRGGAAL